MYNLIVYSNNYLTVSGSLWQYYRDETSLNNNGNIADFTGATSKSFKNQTDADVKKMLNQ